MSGAPHPPLPPRAGIGLKPLHFGDLLEAAERGAGPHWVEVHPQNFMMDGGPMHRWLSAIAERLPLSMHSVALSLGDPDGVDRDELERLALLVERYCPAMVSDHLSWSSLDGELIPDLLPVPLTRASLDHFVTQVDVIQSRLGRPILIENASRLLAFAKDEFDEPQFLTALCRRTGCGLLLDINNIIVSAINLGQDARALVEAIDPDLVGEVHVGGHSVENHGDGLWVAIDDHGSAVSEECWDLLAHFLHRAGPKPVLVERDNDIPDFATLAVEVARADTLTVVEIADAA